MKHGNEIESIKKKMKECCIFNHLVFFYIDFSPLFSFYFFITPLVMLIYHFLFFLSSLFIFLFFTLVSQSPVRTFS